MKYWIYLALSAFVLLISIRVERLDKVKNRPQDNVFDAQIYAQELWSKSLPYILDSAVDINELLSLLRTDKQNAIDKYGKTIGIGTQYSFLVKGEGRIKSLNEDNFSMSTLLDPETQISILTDNIFSNAIRDASGLANVSDFPNTMEFNTISAEINKLVKENVIGPIRGQFKKDVALAFIGAFELDGPGNNGPIRIVPIQLDIKTAP